MPNIGSNEAGGCTVLEEEEVGIRYGSPGGGCWKKREREGGWFEL